MIRERELIALVARSFSGAPARRGDIGIGDDCAVLRAGRRRLLVTTDLMVEGVHFQLSWSRPYLLGRKAVAVSLSDIAAMGGTPRGVFVSAAIPARASAAFARALLLGIHDEAREAGAAVLGGDTSASPGPVFLDVVAIGESGTRGPVLRSGARPGDRIYVSGGLGASALGLEVLRSGLRPRSARPRSRAPSARDREGERRRALILAALVHLLPCPRLDLGRRLADRGLASAMIDISDGLASDLDSLCQASGVGARIEQALIPVHRAVSLAGKRSPRLVLAGGEDYELLFTVPHRKERELLRRAGTFGVRITPIGRITSGKGRVVLVGKDGRARRLSRLGYEHFRRT